MKKTKMLAMISELAKGLIEARDDEEHLLAIAEDSYKDCEALRAQLAEAEERAKTSDGVTAALRSELPQFRERLMNHEKDIQAAIKLAADQIPELESEVAKRDAEIERLKSDLMTARNTLTEERKRVEACERVEELKNIDMAEMLGGRDAAQLEIQNLQNSLAAARNEIVALKKAVTDECDNDERSVDRIRTVTALRIEAMNSQKRVFHLERELVEANRVSASRGDQVAELDHRISELGAALDAALGDLSTAKDAIASKCDQIAARDSTIAALRNESMSAAKTIADLRAELERGRAEAIWAERESCAIVASEHAGLLAGAALSGLLEETTGASGGWGASLEIANKDQGPEQLLISLGNLALAQAADAGAAPGTFPAPLDFWGGGTASGRTV